MSDPIEERPWWAGEDDPDATCDSVGLAGFCGEHCPVLHRGQCRTESEMLSGLRDESVASFFGHNQPAAAAGIDAGGYGPIALSKEG